ncbi:MAG: glycosyltransferase family 4 protein [Limisphaerales bacterium]
MRILLVNETARAHTGGLNRMVVESADWLRRAGHDVALGFWDGGPSEVAAPVFSLPHTDSTAEMRAAVERVRNEFRPEVAQLHLAHNPYFLEEIAHDLPTCRFLHDQSWFCSAGDRMTGGFMPCHRPQGVSCLFWHYAQRCGGKNPLGNWQRWKRVQAQRAVKKNPAFRVQVASEFMRVGLRENGYPDEQIDVIPLFATAPQQPAAIEPGLMLAACRLVKSKGIDVLLRAVQTLPLADWRLNVAGDGPERTRLERLSEQLGLADRVKFLGELAARELDVWYARTALVVSPVLRPEPFGLIGLEAMAHGKPVIAFAGGATEEWLADGKTGIVVRHRSPAALSAAIAELLRQPQVCRSMGGQARRRWEDYRPEVFVRRMVASLERCVRVFNARVA